MQLVWFWLFVATFLVPQVLKAELANPIYLPQSTNPADVVHPYPQGEEPPHSSPGEVTIYEWVDNSGVLHFTDRPEKVPPSYKNRVRERKMKRGTPSPSSGESWEERREEGFSTLPVTTPEEWREMYHNLIEEYRQTYGEYEVLRVKLARAVFQGKPPAELELIRAEKKAVLIKLKELKERLIHFPEELERFREPTYWVTPWGELGLPDPDEGE